MDGGAAGTAGSMAGTSGGTGGTDGGRAPASLVLVSVAGVTLAVAVVNALTTADDFARAGRPLEAWEPWVWELSSAAFWIAVALPLVAVLRRLRPPALGWPAAIGAHVALSLPVCALHVGWFWLSRGIVYAAFGSLYRYDWAVVYEWRKDLLSVLVFSAIGFVLDRRSASPPPAPAPAAPLFRLEVRDGARVRWFAPADIERIEAAGNYVELHTATGTVLHRATLSGVEAELSGHGFVRIHRSRLVRRDAVTAVRTTQAGDFEATMASGATVSGSRRFRSMLE